MDIAARMDFTGLTSGLPARAGGYGEKSVAPERVVMKLEPYRVASLYARDPVAITCLSGQLWITLPGELEDIVLQAGQSRVLSAPARDVVLSTAGAHIPATFGIRAAAGTSNRRTFGSKSAAPFRLEFV